MSTSPQNCKNDTHEASPKPIRKMCIRHNMIYVSRDLDIRLNSGRNPRDYLLAAKASETGRPHGGLMDIDSLAPSLFLIEFCTGLQQLSWLPLQLQDIHLKRYSVRCEGRTGFRFSMSCMSRSARSGMCMIFVPGWRVRSAPSLSSKALGHRQSLCEPSANDCRVCSDGTRR